MQRAEARGQRLPYAAARAALWLLDEFPACVEALLFPGSAFAKVSRKHLSTWGRFENPTLGLG